LGVARKAILAGLLAASIKPPFRVARLRGADERGAVRVRPWAAGPGGAPLLAGGAGKEASDGFRGSVFEP